MASFALFRRARFSAMPSDPLRVDAAGWRELDADVLGAAFQVGGDNPLVGLEGRAALLRRLGEALRGAARRCSAAATRRGPAACSTMLAGAGRRDAQARRAGDPARAAATPRAIWPGAH